MDWGVRRLGLPIFLLGLAIAAAAQTAPGAGPGLTLEQALALAHQHSPALAAAQSQVPQSQAGEVTAALRPNPVLSWDALFLPIFTPGQFSRSYLNNVSEFDASVGYTFERGGKRQARLRAARDATAVVKAQVADAGRGLDFNVAQAFVSALLAQSSLDFAQQNLASWQDTVKISQARYRAGAISEADLDAIQLQTLDFQTAVSGDKLALEQAREALRQQIGVTALPANFTLVGDLAFRPVGGNLDDMKLLALQHRPDLAAARLAVTAAESQHKLAQADGKRDLTTTAQYSHLSAANNMGFLFNIEIPIFDRNQGEIARTAAATTQAKDVAQQTSDQVMTDVGTAFAAVQQGSQVVGLYTSGYRQQAKQALDIRQYAYQKGASSLLDLLDAERTYRNTELGYRQALAAYMLAVEQLKEAVGTRSLP
jgi:cobalt-zinc-cadmium efflux system outer membrane protein